VDLIAFRGCVLVAYRSDSLAWMQVALHDANAHANLIAVRR